MSENLIIPPLLFTSVFPGYRGLQYIQYVLVFWVISIFFTCKKSKFSCPGLQMNSHANFTYSFPQLKIILILTMIRSNRFSFITLLPAQASPFQRYWCGARLSAAKSNAVNLILRLFLHHFLHTMSSWRHESIHNNTNNQQTPPPWWRSHLPLQWRGFNESTPSEWRAALPMFIPRPLWRVW